MMTMSKVALSKAALLQSLSARLRRLSVRLQSLSARLRSRRHQSVAQSRFCIALLRVRQNPLVRVTRRKYVRLRRKPRTLSMRLPRLAKDNSELRRRLKRESIKLQREGTGM